MRPLHEWPMPGSLIATVLIVRGAWALAQDFRRWLRGLDEEMDRRARGEFVTESTRQGLLP